ncbi:DUF3949 domain-containing protein [Bacillus sp. FJAT-49870]|uniref:DUF3949 domain-containing protein n=2 Tax=Lederbergia citri TaxID=2833580 RepID=A0A942TG20_9BACI|nr:DUF3949 domain-containing protein [Lederbergia citri]
MTIVRYRSLVEEKKFLLETGKHHNEWNESMGFEEQQLRFNMQGNLLNIPANAAAMLIYKILHRRNKVTK